MAVAPELTYGELIRRVRKQAGLTQQELCAQLGVTQQALSDWERCGREPNISMVSEIFRLCGAEDRDFLDLRHIAFGVVAGSSGRTHPHRPRPGSA